MWIRRLPGFFAPACMCVRVFRKQQPRTCTRGWTTLVCVRFSTAALLCGTKRLMTWHNTRSRSGAISVSSSAPQIAPMGDRQRRRKTLKKKQKQTNKSKKADHELKETGETFFDMKEYFWGQKKKEKKCSKWKVNNLSNQNHKRSSSLLDVWVLPLTNDKQVHVGVQRADGRNVNRVTLFCKAFSASLRVYMRENHIGR